MDVYFQSFVVVLLLVTLTVTVVDMKKKMMMGILILLVDIMQFITISVVSYCVLNIGLMISWWWCLL